MFSYKSGMKLYFDNNIKIYILWYNSWGVSAIKYGKIVSSFQNTKPNTSKEKK